MSVQSQSNGASAPGPRSPGDGRLRIGELSRRTGVSTDSLRAWERRYGVLRPERSSGGFRLYSSADEARVRTMTRLIDEGLSAAEAARATLGAADAAPSGREGGAEVAALSTALVALDEQAANAIIDRAIATLSIDAFVRDLVLPAMREIGARWQRGEVEVAQEHFATNLIRGRLLGLARGWATGDAPAAILACPPSEQHDLGLIAFGLALRTRGWRIAYLGQDTPIDTVAALAERLGDPPVVLAAVERERYLAVSESVRRLARRPGPLLLGGAGSDPKLAASLGAEHLGDDPVAGASALPLGARELSRGDR